ncbi:hypothetical protein EMIT0P258_30513 [Pseudomonas sp. IT-P258]
MSEISQGFEENYTGMCWLKGRHRGQARSHRKAKTGRRTPRRSSPLIRPSVSSPAALDLDPPAPSEG